MSKIEIPFLEEFKGDLLFGNKRCTTRSKTYGKPGDYFEIFGARFMLLCVTKMDLETIANKFYRAEGCFSPKEFIKIWNKIHPRKGYNPGDVKYFHVFTRIDEPYVYESLYH